MKVKDNIINFYKRAVGLEQLEKTINSQHKHIDKLEKSSRAEAISYQRRSGVGNEVIVNRAAILAAAMQDAYVRAAIEAKKDSILADGYAILPIDEEGSPEADAQKEQFVEWAKTAGGNIESAGEIVNWDEVLRRWVDSFIIGDDYYNELLYPLIDGIPDISVPPQEIHVQDWQLMVQNRDSTGRLEDLKFNKDGSRKSGAYHKVINNRIAYVFDKTEIIHGNYYAKGTQAYGHSLIASIMFVVMTKQFGQKYSADTFFQQQPKQAIYIHTSSVDYFEQTKNQIEESEEKPHGTMILMAPPGEGAGAEGTITRETISTPQDLEYSNFIRDSRSEILVGLRMAEEVVFAPSESKSKDPTIRLHVYDMHINGIKNHFDSIITEELFPRFGWDKIKFVFNKGNKRDELREWQMTRFQMPILTLNEIRHERGYPEIEGGDMIIGQSSPSLEGVPTAQSELGNAGLMSASMPEMITPFISDVKYKNPDYFRKSFGGHRDNTIKRLDSKQTMKITFDSPAVKENKDVLKNLFRFENEYTMNQLELLKSFVNDVVQVLNNNVLNFDRNNLKKIANPDKEFGEIDEIVRKNKALAKEEAIGSIRKTYDFAIDGVATELGVTIAKSSKDFEALRFFDNWNIELIEGSYDDIAKSIKTQIRLGLQNQEGIPEITKRIKGKVGSSVEKIWKNRFRTIARTETARAMSEGRLNGYEKANVQKVQVLIGTGPDDKAICERTFGGSAGGLGKTFTVEQARGLIPRHPNCTCSIVPVVT